MSSSPDQLRPLKVFYSYAHHSRRDASMKRDLEKHLSTLRQQGQIKGWSADNISPGSDQEQETLTNLEKAHIILVLISPDYMDSDNHYEEMHRVIERRKANKSYILFIHLRPTDLEGAECNEYAAYFYPSYDKPITSYSNRDEAFNIIAQGVRNVVEEYREIERAYKAGQTGSRPTPSPINRLNTPITSQSGLTTTGNVTSRKRARQPGSQIEAQIAEPASTQAAWDKKRLPKSRTMPTVNTSQVSRGLSSKDGPSFMRKIFSSKEFDKCTSRKGSSDLLFALLVLLDIVGLTMWLGDSLVVVNLPWPVISIIVILLFLWGVFNTFLPFALILSLVFGGAWALVASHYQGWSGTPIYVIVVVVSIFNFFLFKSHKRPGIFTLH